jgi:hypothetical protein
MADAGIKRVTVLQNNLPPVTINDDQMLYFFRYRMVTEDKNRQSHWSPIYRVILPPIKDKLLSYTDQQLRSFVRIDTSQQGSGIIRVNWSLPTEINNLKEFDVYYRFNYSSQTPFIFGGTVAANNWSAVIPDIGSGFEVAIQIPTYPKTRFGDATIFLKNTTQ